jgi:lysozyme
MEKILFHDISYWQRDLTAYWDLFKAAGCRAVIIQSSNGLAYQNYFDYAAHEAKERGFLVGSYHYYRQKIQNEEGTWYTCDPLKQASNYFNWVSKCGVSMDLPPALDIENAGNPYLSAASIEKTLGFIEKLFGRVPLVYSNPSILHGLALLAWKRYPLWIANYAAEPFIPEPWECWTIWQYSDKLTYTPPGSTVKKPIDHNYFYGSEIDLMDFCYSEGAIPMPDPVERFVRVKLDMKSDYLRFRKSPDLYPGRTLVVGRGDVLKLLSADKVAGDIQYWHVEFDGYQGYVSAGAAYTELV